MLDFNRISALLGDLRDGHVLSVCISADEHDPALRQAWRRRLAAELDELQAGLEAGGTDEAAAGRETFVAARRRLERELAPVNGFLPGPGWVAYVTADAVHFSGSVPARVPDRVRWRRGPVIGPVLRALKQERPVILALVDSRRSRIFRYGAAVLAEVADLRADTWIDDLRDRNTSKRAATHTGTRGETATDAADRILRREMSQLQAEVASRVLDLAGTDGHILLAGPEDARTTLRRLLTAVPEHRVADDVALPVGASAAEVRDAIERHASVLTAAAQRILLDEIRGDARPGGHGAVGLRDVTRAVEHGQVERLLVSADYAVAHEAAVEPVLAGCIARGGVVEAVTGDAADLLPDGVAARLRFVAAPV